MDSMVLQKLDCWCPDVVLNRYFVRLGRVGKVDF